jgi:hypothetical protein
MAHRICFAAALLLALCLANDAAARPNVILIMADDKC